MKRIILLFMSLSTVASSQIKVFSGGAVSYGSTTAPISGEKHKFTGNVVITSSPTNTSSTAYIRGNAGYSAANTPEYTWLGNDQTGLFHPGNNILGFSIGGSEIMRVHSNGNLGIGTTNPSDKFHVAGSSRLNGNVRFDAWTDVLLDWTNGYCCNIPFIWPENDWYLQIGDYSHSVGIQYIYSLYYKSGLYNISDKNAKDNIDYNVNVVAKLKQLKPVTFKYKQSVYQGAPSSIQSGLVSKNHYGLIAQDVANVFPEFVEQDPKSGLYSVNYIELIPILVSAFNFQQNKLDSLQEQLNNCCTKSSSNNRLITPNNNGVDETNSGSYIKQNNPNPFNKETLIEYFVAERNANSSVLVFDMNGKLLKTLKIASSGKGSIIINANDFAPGMYYYSLVVNNKEIGTKKMILTE